MSPKIKNIIIFAVAAIALVLVYIFFIPKSGSQGGLVSSLTDISPTLATGAANSSLTENFLTVLLSLNSISLNDAIFKDPAFQSLVDSSITLTPDGTQGRPNPFAPLGSDTATSAASSSTNTSTPASGTTASPSSSTTTAVTNTNPPASAGSVPGF